MKTIAEQIKWDFEANGYLKIKDKNGKLIYYECSIGFWSKMEYDFQGNRIYYKSSNGFWEKKEYDSRGNQIYLENLNGIILDKRPKSCEGEEIIIEGIKYKLTKV